MSPDDAAQILLRWGPPLLIGVGLLLELGLRWAFGFGNPLLYQSHETIGYVLAPNQDVRRFGNRIVINCYSMRSGAIAPEPDAHTLRLLLLGDSIANGGWWTAQDQTLSARLQAKLCQMLASESGLRQRVEVLNASANSWGPRNELAYVESYGVFGASVLILLINTDDLFATAPTSVQVGRDRNYPDRKPPLALAEVVSRYLMTPQPISELEAVQAEGGDRVGHNLEAVRHIHALVKATGGECLLAMTPLLRELGEPGPRDYEQVARDRLIRFAHTHGLPYLDFLPIFNSVESPHRLYRDHIHLNGAGNERVVEHVQRVLREPPFSLSKLNRIPSP